MSIEAVVRVCMLAFPSLWVSCNAPFCIAAIKGILVHTDFFSCTLIDPSLAFGVLTCTSVWALQVVSASRRLAFFLSPDLSFRAFQVVCAPYWLKFFPCPDLSLCLGSPGRECPLLASSCIIFVFCPDLSICLGSPGSECLLLARILSMS